MLNYRLIKKRASPRFRARLWGTRRANHSRSLVFYCHLGAIYLPKVTPILPRLKCPDFVFRSPHIGQLGRWSHS